MTSGTSDNRGPEHPRASVAPLGLDGGHDTVPRGLRAPGYTPPPCQGESCRAYRCGGLLKSQEARLSPFAIGLQFVATCLRPWSGFNECLLVHEHRGRHKCRGD